MEELKRRILSDAVVGEGDIIHVDMFLNHCMDINLMEHMGNALAKRFRGVRITKVLTAESSGIALACFVARALDVPAVYAKKFQTGYIDPEVYSAETHSFSLEKSYTLRVSKKYLDGDDVVLLVDDILSNGQAILSLLELVSKAGGEVAGVGVATSFVGPPGGTGRFFAAVKTRGLWEGGITSVLFYVMAVVTAAAFLIVAYRLLARLRGARPDGSALVGLNRVLAASLFALAFCVFFQIAPPLLSGDPASATAVGVMVSGSLAPLFWIGEIGLGLAVPAALLAVGAFRSRCAAGGVWTVAAAVSAMAGILALRYVLVVAGFSVPLLGGMPLPAYVPTLGEAMVTLFVLGLAVGCYGLAVRLLPLERRSASEGEARLESSYEGAGSAAVSCGGVSTGKEVRDGGAA